MFPQSQRAGVPPQPSRDAAFGWFREVLGGQLEVATDNGLMLLAPESEGGGFSRTVRGDRLLSLLWWTRHPKEWPVLAVYETPQFVVFFHETPTGWSSLWRDRWNRAAEAFAREHFKGEAGQVLKHFELGSPARVVDFLRNSVENHANAKQAH